MINNAENEMRKITLIDEISFHINTWKEDDLYSNLPSSIKDSLNAIVAEITVLEQSKSLSQKHGIDVTSSSSHVTNELKKFIAIFEQRYTDLTNLNYEEKLSPIQRLNLKSFVEELILQGSSAMEYLEWFFDDFCRLENVKKYMPPNLMFCHKDWVKNKFYFLKKDDLARRRGDAKISDLKRVLVQMANEMFNSTHNEEIGKNIILVSKGQLPVTNFKKIVEKFAKKYQFTEIIGKLNEMNENKG